MAPLATDSPTALDQALRDAALEALCHEDFGLATPHDTSADFAIARSTVPSAPAYAPGISEFLAGWVFEASDISTANPASRLEDRIVAAQGHEEVIDALMVLGHHATGDRLRYLHGLAEDDDDEPAMLLASLRRLALFLVSEQDVVAPEIGLGPDGLLQAQWRLGDGGLSAMKFLPDDLIQFAAVCGPAPGDGRRRRVHGTLAKDEVLAAVRGFLPAEDML